MGIFLGLFSLLGFLVYDQLCETSQAEAEAARKTRLADEEFLAVKAKAFFASSESCALSQTTSEPVEVENYGCSQGDYFVDFIRVKGCDTSVRYEVTRFDRLKDTVLFSDRRSSKEKIAARLPAEEARLKKKQRRADKKTKLAQERLDKKFVRGKAKTHFASETHCDVGKVKVDEVAMLNVGCSQGSYSLNFVEVSGCGKKITYSFEIEREREQDLVNFHLLKDNVP